MSNWGLMVFVGVLSVVAGAFALLFPLPASLTVTAFVGASLMAVGVLGTFAAYNSARERDRFWGMMTGLLTVALGFILLAFPLQGMATLTIIAGMIFVVLGLFKLVLGWALNRAAWKWAVILSGLLTAGLGLVILIDLPRSAAFVPGVLLAIELLSYGIGMIFLGLSWRHRGVNPGGNSDVNSDGN
jgi:uncharacterized membrane protein HdeD (DUF308 family)